MLLNIYFLFSFFFPKVADREFLFKNMMGIKVKLFHFICSLNARTCKINFVYDVIWDHKIWHMGGGFSIRFLSMLNIYLIQIFDLEMLWFFDHLV